MIGYRRPARCEWCIQPCSSAVRRRPSRRTAGSCRRSPEVVESPFSVPSATSTRTDGIGPTGGTVSRINPLKRNVPVGTIITVFTADKPAWRAVMVASPRLRPVASPAEIVSRLLDEPCQTAVAVTSRIKPSDIRASNVNFAVPPGGTVGGPASSRRTTVACAGGVLGGGDGAAGDRSHATANAMPITARRESERLSPMTATLRSSPLDVVRVA